MYFLTSCVDLYSKYLTYQNITAILLADAMKLQKVLFFDPVYICGWDNNPTSFAHSTYWKSHINNTVWQNIGTKVFLIFIQYTEPAAINKSKRLIKYLNSLNRIAKKRGLLQSVPAFHHIHVPRWTYGTTFYFSSRRNDPHKFRSWIDNSVNL